MTGNQPSATSAVSFTLSGVQGRQIDWNVVPYRREAESDPVADRKACPLY